MIKHSKGDNEGNNYCWKCNNKLNKNLIFYSKHLKDINSYLITTRCGLCGQLNMYLVNEPLKDYFNK